MQPAPRCRRPLASALRLNELAQPIGAAVGLRLHRLAFEVALEVIGQRRRTLITLGRLALERFADHCIEITFQCLGTRLVVRSLAGLSQIAAQQLGFQRTLLGRAIQARLGEQLEQHDAERIHIGRNRDR